MVLVGFLFQDNLERIWWFEETFLLADISIKVVLWILFIPFSNADMGLQKAWLDELHNAEAMSLVIMRRVKFVDRREFIIVVPLDKSFLFDNTSKSFENTCLGPVSYHICAPEFAFAAVVQEWLGNISYYLEELLPTQSLTPIQCLLIALTNLEI